MDIVEKIDQFENDQLSKQEIIELFQKLVDTGLAWELQGFYAQYARKLIERGVIRK